MTPRRWRLLRRLAATAFLGLLVAVLAVPAWRPALQTLSAFQLLPALLRLVVRPGWLAALGLLAVLLLSVLFGRLYCSLLCPFGILQDLMTSLRHPRLPLRGLRWRRTERLVHAVWTLSLLAVLAGGSAALLGLFEPFALTVRLFGDAVMAVVDAWVRRIPRPAKPSWEMLLLSVAPLAVLLSVPWTGRWYCETLCPAGAVLRLFGRLGLRRPAIRSACVSCGRCERVCPVGCVDYRGRSVDAERCVMCLDCLAVCPVDAVVLTGPELPRKGGGGSRRAFLGTATLAILALASPVRAAASFVPPRPDPVMPPSAGSRRRFHRLCVACHACVNACPTRVLVPAVREYGWRGVGQPVMAYGRSFCDYECVRCTWVCPSGALRPLTQEEKERTVMGRVRLDTSTCIPYELGRDCGACAEHCPTQAVYMVPQGRVYAPRTDPALCVGCGACERVCPVRRTRGVSAIRVAGLRIQERLPLRPSEPAAAPPPAGTEDGFPF